MSQLKSSHRATHPSAEPPQNGASTTRLPNGLTVIHQQMISPAVAIDIWVDAGAGKEPLEWSGMAHFLEHMVFKGTARLQPGEFDVAIESQGGVSNAATSHDYAHYYVIIAAEAVAQTLPYLAELVLGAAIPAAEFDAERNVVLEEMRQADDDPDGVGYQVLCDLLYAPHAYGRPVLGTPESLKTFSPEKMRQFHQAHYQPENMIVAIAGNLSKESAIAHIQAAFSQFPQPVPCPLPNSHSQHQPLPKLTQARKILRLEHLEQCRLTLAWVGPGIDELAASAHMDIISTVLGGGRSSRLVRELREEKQLVQEVEVDFSLQRDCGEFSITLWLEESELAVVEKILGDRLTTLSTQLIPLAELTRAKRLLLNDYAFSTETPSQIAGLYGYYATLSSPDLVSLYPQNIRTATAEAIQQTAQKYLNPAHYTAVTLKPKLK